MCFEWKYMMCCVSLSKLKFVFPSVNVISIQGHHMHPNFSRHVVLKLAN